MELPMFPLGTVLLPTVGLPLHVFEPRYRALVRDVLDRESEFGVVLIARGSEVGGGDVRTDVGTSARIVESAELPDERWALVAVGTERIRVVEWRPDDPYPRAEVEPWPDAPPAAGHDERLAEMVAVLRRALALAAEAGDETAPSTIELSPDPVLAGYQAAAVAPIGPFDRQLLLAAATPDERVAALQGHLEEAVELLTLRLGSQGWE